MTPAELRKLEDELLARIEARNSIASWIKYRDIGLTPALHHELIIRELERLERGETTRLMLMLPPGSAKALALDTPIPTPNGWSTMGGLKVGDKVFDERGVQCTVTWKSPVWKDRPVYRVKTDCGDVIIADRDHEWLVCLCRKHGAFKIKETHELCRSRSKRPMIAKAGPLELPDADLPVDPYLLGLWLGDGSSSNLSITAHEADEKFYREELAEIGIETSDRATKQLFGVLGQRAKFVSLGLVNDPAHKTYGRKHIPAEYLRASRAQRLSLLQGLVDSDGTVCKSRGCTTFTNTNHELATQVHELVRTLGVKAAITSGTARINGKDCGPYYRVAFYLSDSARLPRKSKLTRNQYRTPNTYIDVEFAGLADTVCIQVNSPSHLFLCGRSMTPTHNSTYTSVEFPPWFIGRNPKSSIIAASHTLDLAERFGRKARNIVASREFKNVFDFGISEDSQAAGKWETTTGAEYFAVGVGGSVTGRRADLGIIDDPVKGREDADSERSRETVWQWYLNDFLTRLKPNARQVVIQTRWHEADLAGRILEREASKWRVISIPMIASSDDPLGRKPGDRLWPDWFTDEMVQDAQRDVRSWNALYQQNPVPEEGNFFKKDWFVEYDDSDLPTTLHKYGSSDFAVTDKGGDYTEHAVWGVDFGGDLWLLDYWYGQTAPDRWIEELCDLILKHRPLTWFGEAGPIRRSVEPFLRKRMDTRGAYCNLEWLASINDKATRARPFQALASMGKVKIPRNKPWMAHILSQWLQFPAGRVDDAVDAASLIGRGLEFTQDASKREKRQFGRQVTSGWMG